MSLTGLIIDLLTSLLLARHRESVQLGRAVATAVRKPLPLAAVVAPGILPLRPFEGERVPAWLIACAGVKQHAGHVVGMDGQQEAAVGARLQGGPHEGLLLGG